MLTRWNGSWAAPWMGDVLEDYGTFGELRRHMSRVLDELDRTPGHDTPLTLEDTGEALRVRGELPGFSHKDIDVQIEHRTLTIRAKREVKVPEGYVVHRRERSAMQIARAFTLPCRIDPERANAVLRDGILELTLPKAAEERPRRVEVRAS
jgi:HSP20 family protein